MNRYAYKMIENSKLLQSTFRNKQPIPTMNGSIMDMLLQNMSNSINTNTLYKAVFVQRTFILKGMTISGCVWPLLHYFSAYFISDNYCPTIFNKRTCLFVSYNNLSYALFTLFLAKRMQKSSGYFSLNHKHRIFSIF